MDDKRNLIAAILLSVAILLGWNFVSEKFFPTPDKPDVTTTVAGTNGTAPAATPGQPAALPAPGVPAVTCPRNRGLAGVVGRRTGPDPENELGTSGATGNLRLTTMACPGPPTSGAPPAPDEGIPPSR